MPVGSVLAPIATSFGSSSSRCAKRTTADGPVEVVPGEPHRLAEPRRRLLVRRHDAEDRRVRRQQARLDDDAAVAPGRGSTGPRESTGSGVRAGLRASISTTDTTYGARRPVVRLDRRPEPRHLLGVDRLVRDRHRLELVGEVGGGQRLERRRQDRRAERARVERPADRGAVEHRPLVQQVHRVAEQDLGLEVGAAVGGEQVVQVERERRVETRVPFAVEATAARPPPSPG